MFPAIKISFSAAHALYDESVCECECVALTCFLLSAVPPSFCKCCCGVNLLLILFLTPWTTQPGRVLDHPAWNGFGPPILAGFWTTQPGRVLDQSAW